MKIIYTEIIIIICTIFISLLLILIISEMAKVPTVSTSYATGKCFKVINYDPDNSYSCNNLPKKYNHQYVK